MLFIKEQLIFKYTNVLLFSNNSMNQWTYSYQVGLAEPIYLDAPFSQQGESITQVAGSAASGIKGLKKGRESEMRKAREFCRKLKINTSTSPRVKIVIRTSKPLDAEKTIDLRHVERITLGLYGDKVVKTLDFPRSVIEFHRELAKLLKQSKALNRPVVVPRPRYPSMPRVNDQVIYLCYILLSFFTRYFSLFTYLWLARDLLRSIQWGVVGLLGGFVSFRLSYPTRDVLFVYMIGTGNNKATVHGVADLWDAQEVNPLAQLFTLEAMARCGGDVLMEVVVFCLGYHMLRKAIYRCSLWVMERRLFHMFAT